MNALEIYLRDLGMSETAALNRLQDAGVVSDECVTVADVADCDCLPAIMWLEEHE